MTFGDFYDIIKNKAVEKLFSPSSAITELLPQNNREGSIVNINEMTVLICDDSMFARKKLSMSISGFGVKAVYEAADGEEAVSKSTCAPRRLSPSSNSNVHDEGPPD